MLELIDPVGLEQFGTVRAERPKIEVEIRKVGWKYWHLFRPHHYLDAGPMAFSTAFVGFVGEDPVVHMGMSGMHVGKGRREGRACRMVVMPEWQGAGISLRFMNFLCEREMQGEGFIQSKTTVQFHTAHPALCKALRRDPKWRQISQALHGNLGSRSMAISADNDTKTYGGHWRVITGYRYYGAYGIEADKQYRAEQEAKLAAETGIAMEMADAS